MFCKNCGKQIADGAASCPYCGYSRAAGAQPGQPAAPAYLPPMRNSGLMNSETDYGKTTETIATIFTVIIAILSIIAVIAFNSYDDDLLLISILGEVAFLLILITAYFLTMAFAQLVTDTREVRDKTRKILSNSGSTNEYLNQFLKDGVNVYVIDDDDEE